jgi:hypothetical protein
VQYNKSSNKNFNNKKADARYIVIHINGQSRELSIDKSLTYGGGGGGLRILFT